MFLLLFCCTLQQCKLLHLSKAWKGTKFHFPFALTVNYKGCLFLDIVGTVYHLVIYIYVVQ